MLPSYKGDEYVRLESDGTLRLDGTFNALELRILFLMAEVTR